jgi:hypothetical protein
MVSDSVTTFCRSALEILEGEVREERTNERDPGCSAKEDKTLKYRQRTSSVLHKYLVQIDHMARALARTFRSPVVETIQDGAVFSCTSFSPC